MVGRETATEGADRIELAQEGLGEKDKINELLDREREVEIELAIAKAEGARLQLLADLFNSINSLKLTNPEIEKENKISRFPSSLIDKNGELNLLGLASSASVKREIRALDACRVLPQTSQAQEVPYLK